VASQGPGALRFWFTPWWASRSAGGYPWEEVCWS